MDPKDLIQEYFLGSLDAEGVQRLEALLAEDAELRQQYVLAAAIETSLRAEAIERASQPVLNGPGSTKRLRYWLVGLSLTAALLIGCGLWITSLQAHSIATLVSSENAAWESRLPTTPGSQLGSGRLKLKSGLATIRFRSGALVVLEAPGELELMSSMRGKMHSGAAVIDVPEEAIGFVMETPEGYAVDYGTKFAVRVDQVGNQSDFEILEGEIAVHHPETGEEVRLKGQGKAAMVSKEALSVVDVESRAVLPAEDLVRIGTNGRFGSAIRNDKRKKFINPEVLSVKRTKGGKWDHRSFFSFDLKEVPLDKVTSARLRLNLVPSNRGFISRLPKLNRFEVYGLTNQAKQDWPTECLWAESPGPEDGVLLGTFEIPRSEQRGSFGIKTEELLKFLRSNQNGSVTLIIVRDTTHVAGIGPGFVHMFASDLHPESVGPMLELSRFDGEK